MEHALKSVTEIRENLATIKRPDVHCNRDAKRRLIEMVSFRYRVTGRCDDVP